MFTKRVTLSITQGQTVPLKGSADEEEVPAWKANEKEEVRNGHKSTQWNTAARPLLFQSRVNNFGLILVPLSPSRLTREHIE